MTKTAITKLPETAPQAVSESDMRTLMTQVPLESASNSLWCAFIYMRARTDLTPEERAALEAAKAAADVFSGMVYDRIVSPARAAGQAEDAA